MDLSEFFWYGTMNLHAVTIKYIVAFTILQNTGTRKLWDFMHGVLKTVVFENHNIQTGPSVWNLRLLLSWIMLLLLSTVIASSSSLVATFSICFALSKQVFGSFANLAFPCSSCLTLPRKERRSSKCPSAQNARPFGSLASFPWCALACFPCRCSAWASWATMLAFVKAGLSICLSTDPRRFPLHQWLSPSYNGFLFQG